MKAVRLPILFREGQDVLGFVSTAKPWNDVFVEPVLTGNVQHDGVVFRHTKDDHLTAETIERKIEHRLENAAREPSARCGSRRHFDYLRFRVPVVV